MAQIEAGPVAYRRSLFVTARAYAVLHHLGLLPAGTARWRGTSWVDWLDHVVPYAALAPAALTLATARVTGRHWGVFAVGALAYTQGHGIHLAANSIGNADPGETAYLWDELAGHAIWYAGAAVVMFVLAATMARESPRAHPLGVLVALGVGATWATNALGRHTIPLTIVVALAGIGGGWTRRHTVAWLTGIAGAAALVVLAGAALP